MKTKRINLTLFILLLGITILLELGAAYLAFYTISEIHSALYYLLIGVVNVGVLALFYFKQQWAAIAASVLLFLYLVPEQVMLGHKMLKLQEEAANITNFAYRYKLVSGSFPSDLNAYTFTYPDLLDHMQYSIRETGVFCLSYHIGTPSTSHFYCHSLDDKWFYYPD